MLNNEKTLKYHCRKMVETVCKERLDKFTNEYPEELEKHIFFPEKEFDKMDHNELRSYVTFITEFKDGELFKSAIEDEDMEMKFFDVIDELNDFVEFCLAKTFPLSGKGNHTRRADMVFRLNAKKYLDNESYMYRFRVLSYNYKEEDAKLYACFWKAIYSGLLYSKDTLKYSTRIERRLTVDSEKPIDEPYADYVGFIIPPMLNYSMFSKATLHMHKVESINRSTYINFVIKINSHDKSLEKILEFYSINVEKRIQYKIKLNERKRKQEKNRANRSIT